MALRIFQLGRQSFWYDEAFSVYLSRFDVVALTARTAADIQPPLYYYLVHFWLGAAGDGEFAVRFLSLWFGVLTVPLLYVTARRLFAGRALAVPAGAAAALIGTVSALYVWYSQEARMYTLITFLGLLSSYALLRALRGAGTGRWWVLFCAANIAAVYTHYFAFALIAFQLLYTLGALVRDRSALRGAVVSFVAILAAFVPWVPFLVNRLGEDASYFRGDLKLDEAVRHIFINFATGESALEAVGTLIAGLWLVLLLVGLVGYVLAARKDAPHPAAKDARSRGGGLAFAILYLVVPLVLLLFLFSRNPKFNARYLMLASPGLYLLLAAGLASFALLLRSRGALGRIAAALAFAVLALGLFVPSLYAINNAYFDPAFTKADFRGVASYVTGHAAPDEAIVLTSGHLFPAFDYYYRAAALPELRLPDEPTLNADRIVTYDAAPELNRALAGKRGAWLVQWQDEVADPNGFVPMLLSQRGAEQPVGTSFWQVKLRHWVFAEPFAPLPPELEIAHPEVANFQNTFQLLGWDQPAPTPADVGASLRLYWQATASTPDDYLVALRIVDERGTFWGKLDRRPAGYNYPTMRWKPGELVFGDYIAELLPGTPAGEYYATVTLFTRANETGLDVLAPNGAPRGKSVRVGPLRILPAQKQPALTDLKIQHSLSTPSPPFTLLGYQLGREQASTGESVPVTLFWRADAAPGADYTFRMLFGDAPSEAIPLANATYPTSQWRAGEIVRGQYAVQIPPDAPASQAGLRVQLDGGGGTSQVLDLAQPFGVSKVDRLLVEPPMSYRQDANFDDRIALVGYDLSSLTPKGGDVFTVTLYWKALAAPDKPYTVFVHLLDKDSQVKAQKDAQPLNGGRPTQTWIAGEYLADAYALALPGDLAPGTYRVELGWYDAADPAFARLAVRDANGQNAGDHILLEQSITVP